MVRRPILLFLILSTSFSGGFPEQTPTASTVVLEGQVAVLPCQHDDHQFVEWSRENLEQNVVLLYRDGKEEHGMKNKAFFYRTSLVRPEMDQSDKSLRIANVQLSDEGKYTCRNKSNGVVHVVTTVWLSVVTVSKPQLTMVSSANGPTVLCGVRFSSIELKMEFLDNEGTVLRSAEPKFHFKDTRFVNVTLEMLVPDSITRITCRVTQTKINQTWLTQTLIVPDYCKASYTPHIIGIIVTLAAFVVVFVVLIFVFFGIIPVQCCKCGPTVSQPSSASEVKSPSENRPLMDDVDGIKVKVNPQTRRGTFQKQRDKTPQLSPPACHPATQPPATSGSATSTDNNTLKGGKLSLVKQKSVGEQPSKPENRFPKNQEPRLRRTMSDSCYYGPNIPKLYGQYSTVHSGNRFSLLSEEHCDADNVFS